MINTGKCPKCDKRINHVHIDTIEAQVGIRKRFNAVSYVCPYCHAVLGVQIDPVALKNDCVNEIIEFLKGKKW